MLIVRFGSVLAALLLSSATVLAQGAKLTDPQIAHIAYTAGQLDIEAAQQALQKSKNKDVIAFAQDMERDHKAVNDQALAFNCECGRARPCHSYKCEPVGWLDHERSSPRSDAHVHRHT